MGEREGRGRERGRGLKRDRKNAEDEVEIGRWRRREAGGDWAMERWWWI